MKVLLLDDERSTRESIKRLIYWPDYHITEILEADQGEKGLRLIQDERPDLIITDMKMPMMDGAALLNRLNELKIECPIIVVSGYTDFAYTQVAIRSHVVDYLVKPIKHAELKQAIEKAATVMKKGSESTSESNPVEYYERLHREKYRLSDYNFSTYIDTHSFPDDTVFYWFALIRMTNFEKVKDTRYNGIADLLYYRLEQLTADLMKAWEASSAVIRPIESHYDMIVLIAFNPRKYERMKDGLLPKCRELLSTLEEKTDVTCHLAYQDYIRDLTGIPNIYRKARNVLHQTNVLESGTMLHVDEALIVPLISLYKDEWEWIQLIQGGHREQAKRKIRDLLDSMKASGSVCVKQLEYLCVEVISILTYYMKSTGIKTAVRWSEHVGNLNILKVSSSIELTEHWVMDSIDLICDTIERLDGEKETNANIVEIIDYIHTHYREKIDLESLSKIFYLSREHISRLFKKHTGENLIEYVTKYRMEKAQRLLLQSDHKVQTVADMVGVSEETYFSRLFKKRFGTSPSEYRTWFHRNRT